MSYNHIIITSFIILRCDIFTISLIETTKWLASNSILVNIYYGKMSYQTLDEEFAYSINDMICKYK